MSLNYKIEAKQKFIHNFDKGKGYTTMKEVAAEQTNYVLQGNRLL